MAVLTVVVPYAPLGNTLKLYEIDIGHIFWVASYDELDVLSLLREEMDLLEIPDEEVDEALENPEIIELNRDEADIINVVDEYGESIYTLWDMFMRQDRPGVVTSDFKQEYCDELCEEFI